MPDHPLAPVYLDNEPVALPGEARPQVAQVLAARGRSPDAVDVLLLDEWGADTGTRLDPEDVLDRTAAVRPIYLTTFGREDAGPDAGSGEGVPDLPGVGAAAARIGSGSGGASQFGQGRQPGEPPPRPPTPRETTAPGVSGQGNAAGSAQSAYSRTGTDTLGPGMIRQEAPGGFGSGTGKGTSSGARESGKPAPASRMAAGLEDPFGKEGLRGPQGEAKSIDPSLPAARAPSGTGSEPASPDEPGPEPDSEPDNA